MTWLNSDDKFHPHAFFIVAAVLRQRPDVEWLTGRSNLYDEKGRQTYICEYLLPHSHAKYLHKKYANPWIQQEGTFWRRNLWDLSGAGVRSDLDFAGDLELWLRFFRTSRLYIVDALLAGYRFQPNSKARLFMEKYRQEADAVIECERKRYPDEGYDKLIPAPESISFLKIQDTATQLIRNFSAADSSALKICDALKSGIDLAIEFYQKSIQTDPNNSRAHNSLGMLYWQSGKSKEALEEFTAALRIDPNYPAPVLSIGDILGIIGKKELKDKLFESYLVKNPRDRKLFEDLASFVIKN